jgi:hypothetical protein
VARQVVQLARAAGMETAAGADARASHVGYYLSDAGRARPRDIPVRRLSPVTTST